LTNDHECNIDIIYVVIRELCHNLITYDLSRILTISQQD